MTRKTRLYLGVILANVLYWAPGCFREAAPCDQSGFDAVAETCVTDRLDAVACNERLLGHEQRCAKRIEAE